jgi:integrase
LWGELTSAFREAATSKHDALRVRTGAPTALVQPPTAGTSRESTGALPARGLRTARAPGVKVPLYRKALYAVAIYTGARVCELRGLTAEDIDLEHDCVCVRPTESGGQRERPHQDGGRAALYPIEPALRSLLEALPHRGRLRLDGRTVKDRLLARSRGIGLR